MSTEDTIQGDTTVQVTIDGESQQVERNRPVIEVAREYGEYVPGWCHHPGMRPAAELDPAEKVYRPTDGPTTTPPRGVPAVADTVGEAGDQIVGETEGYDACGMCKVEVDGELVRACETRIRAGMAIETATEAARSAQQAAMAEVFKHHPHACLSCPYKEGCDRISCTMNVDEEHRCCDLIGNCELEKSAAEIDLDWNEVPEYEPLERSAQRTPVFDVNWELCIGCNRCVGVCEDHVGAGVWRFTGSEADGSGSANTGATVGLKADTLAKSGCKYCTACVDACPTGTLMDNEGGQRDRLPTEFRSSLPDVAFPESRQPLTSDVLRTVPAQAGVYTLYDDEGTVTEINGVADLADALADEVESADAVEFEYELDEHFTQRETELIEQYVNEHGHMPGMGGGMDDLF